MGMTRSRRAAVSTTAAAAATEAASSDAPEPAAIDPDVQEMYVVALMANSPFGVRGTREELTCMFFFPSFCGVESFKLHIPTVVPPG